MPKIMIGIPTYDSRVDARQALYLFGARRDNLVTDVRTRQLSALCWCFNQLWCDALNDKTNEYFLLLHADIVPYAPMNWLSKAISEMTAARADVLSVVSPIKNSDGLTSTALVSAQHRQPRRVSMKELAQLPNTFDARDVMRLFGWEQHEDARLYVNTGCMFVNLQKRNVLEGMSFRTHDYLERDEKNKLVPRFIPEDWDFSEQAHRNNLRVCATQSIKLIHNGSADYRNEGAWGDLEHDAMLNIGV